MAGGIVVGTDGSPCSLNAVDEAGRLAAREGAVVHVVSAYRDQAPALASLGMPDPGGSLVIDHRPRAERALAVAAERLAGCGVAVERHAVEGPAAEAICQVASANDADLIVVGSQGMRGGRRLVGSVPNTVTHKAHCNVLVVRTD